MGIARLLHKRGEHEAGSSRISTTLVHYHDGQRLLVCAGEQGMPRREGTVTGGGAAVAYDNGGSGSAAGLLAMAPEPLARSQYFDVYQRVFCK